jgi:hypothetical protein
MLEGVSLSGEGASESGTNSSAVLTDRLSIACFSICVAVGWLQIATSSSMATPLRELRRLVRLRLSEARDIVGYNLAALKLVARIAQEKKASMPAIEDGPSANVWAGLGLGSDVAAALERKSGSKRRR